MDHETVVIKINWIHVTRYSHHVHCVKSVRIRSFFGPYSVQMREDKNQKNSEYTPFLRSGSAKSLEWD